MRREPDYDEILRRALRAATDSIEPAGDGLERIRARLTMPRPLAAAWLVAGFTDVALPALVRLWSALGGLWVWLRTDAASNSVWASLTSHVRRPGLALGGLARSRLVRRYGWLRPAAVATAVVVAVAGGFALTQLQGTIIGTGAVILPLGGGGSHGHGGSPDSGSVNKLPGPSQTSAGGPVPSSSPSASASCGTGSSLGSPGPTPTPTKTRTTPTPSPDPSPTVTATATPSGNPTATPTTTDNPAGGASPVVTSGGVLPPGGPALPSTSSDSTKNTSPAVSPSPCGSGRSTRTP